MTSMDQQFDFRALLLKLQDCLSDNDRRRLHFIVGDTIPRYLRDDPTLSGTLSLLESLFDQAKISDQDFDYLIYAFREIHCYEAVKRLKEHQLTQHRQIRSETTITNISDLFTDNETDKISPKCQSHFVSSDSSEACDSRSSQETTISFEQPNTTKDKLSLTKTSIQSVDTDFKLDKTHLKQIVKSRLTIFQFVLLFFNFIGILTFILLIVFFTKAKRSKSDILLIKAGTFYGNTAGGDYFNDAADCSLTFDDQIISITAGWNISAIDYITFYYSNGRCNQHGEQITRYSPYTSQFNLDSDETIIGATIYTGTRLIDNPYEPNGSFLIVGLRFYTSKGNKSDLFGSSNGIQTDEILSGFNIAYVRGRSLSYLDALQFIWYKETAPTKTAALSTY